MSPEEKARLVIDEKLNKAGYTVQDVKEFNPKASLGVAVREWQTDSGPCDYLIFIGGVPCGLIEAKEHDKGEKLTSVAEQTRRYAESEARESLAAAAPRARRAGLGAEDPRLLSDGCGWPCDCHHIVYF